MTTSPKHIPVRRRHKPDAKSAIIDVLGSRGESTKWDLAKETGMHYSTCFKAVKSLTKRGLIRIVRSDKLSEKGQKIKTYNLTIEGLVRLLDRMHRRRLFVSKKNHRQVEKIIDKIVKLHAAMLPLVFGKWTLFQKAGITDLAIETLLLTAYQHWEAIREQEKTVKKLRRRNIPKKHVVNYLLWPNWFLDHPIVLGRPDLQESFTEFFYRIRLIIPNSDDRAKWLQTISSDDELRLYILDILSNAEKVFRSEAEMDAAMIRSLRNAGKEDVDEDRKD